MCSRRRFTAAAALLALGGVAVAGEAAPKVVRVRYRVAEQDPARVETTVTNRLEPPLQQLPRVAAMHSVTGHGTVLIEIAFEDGANEQDVTAVTQRLDQLKPGPDVVVLSRTVELGGPSLERSPPEPQPR
jgi:multidrug efflux pump subunit AcrB